MDGDADFLYPFLAGHQARPEVDLATALADVERSSLKKAGDTIALRRQIDVEAIVACAADVRARLERGGQLLALGNGGSATDAQDLAFHLLEDGWPAVSLVDDAATLTAVSNDVDFGQAFARQIAALGGRDDVAVAISTSGSSENIAAALGVAKRLGMLTCAISGYGGGRLADAAWLDHLLLVGGDAIPRIQEAQATVYHLLAGEVGAR